MSISDLPIPMLVLIAIVVLYLLNSIKILREYERGVIFRLGRVLGTPKGPGLSLIHIFTFQRRGIFSGQAR